MPSFRFWVYGLWQLPVGSYCGQMITGARWKGCNLLRWFILCPARNGTLSLIDTETHGKSWTDGWMSLYGFFHLARKLMKRLSINSYQKNNYHYTDSSNKCLWFWERDVAWRLRFLYANYSNYLMNYKKKIITTYLPPYIYTPRVLPFHKILMKPVEKLY